MRNLFAVPALIGSFLLLAFLLAPSASGQQPSLGRIVGQMHVLHGDSPAHPVMVSLEFRGYNIKEAYADAQGRFGFEGLAANLYRVIVNDEDYNPVNELVTVNPAANPLNIVEITLTARVKTKEDPLKARTSSNPYLVNPADYNKKFPKKAVKEFERGVKSDAEGNHAEAIRHYQSALKIAPEYYPAHNNLGSSYMSTSNFTEAKTQFEEAIRLNKEDSEAYFNLGNLFLLTKNYDESSKIIAGGLRLRPDSAFGHFLMGSLYSHTGQPTDAEASLRRSLQLDPKMSQSYLQLVNLYMQQGRQSEAIEELEAYLKAFPDTPFSPKARDLLKRLQKPAESTQ